MKSRILGFLIRNVAQGIPRNPTNDWNPKSNLNRKGIRNPVPGIRNPQRQEPLWLLTAWNPESESVLNYPKKSVFTWRHRGHIGVLKQWHGGHIGVPDQSCGELNSFLMQTLSFVPLNLHWCWPREWKHAMREANSFWHSTTKGEGINFSLIFVNLDRTYYPSRPRGWFTIF